MTRPSRVVLLVEPNPSLSSAMAGVLRSAGYPVLVAGDADEALALCGEINDIALLIAELVLPGMGAIELAQRMAIQIPGVQFLFLTATEEEALLKQAMRTRGEVLRKPIALSELAHDVHRLLGR